MKKNVYLWLLTLLLLTSCSKSEEAQEIDDMILSLGTITLESEFAIMEMENIIIILDPSIKKELDYLDILVKAREDYSQLCIDVVEQAISEIGNITVDSNDKILQAWDKYDVLEQNLKGNVSNYATLVEAEELFLSPIIG